MSLRSRRHLLRPAPLLEQLGGTNLVREGVSEIDNIKQNGRERERESCCFLGVFIYRGSTCCQVCTSVVSLFL